MKLKPALIAAALLGANPLAAVQAAWQPNSAAQPSADPTLAIRDTLTRMPASAALRMAAQRYAQKDPTASFTWLRGHVDAFSARPKTTIPDYARPILAAQGSTIVPSAPVLETSADQRREPGGTPMPPAEADSHGSATFDSADDPMPPPGGTRPADDERPLSAGGGTQWFAQQGKGAVKDILLAFLRQNNDLFEMDQGLLNQGLPNLQLSRYGVGRHFRRAEFTQTIDGVPVLDGKTLVLFDVNYNVIAISRQLMTSAKLGAPADSPILDANARGSALSALAAQLGASAEALRVRATRLGVDPIRAHKVWQVDLEDRRTGDDYTVSVHGTQGQVLNVADTSARFTDAVLRRWKYPDGNLLSASQVLSTGQYTHDDNTLVHDYFYLVNDDRNDGGSGTCTNTSPASTTTPNAYGSTTSTEYVRPTRRADRDFSNFFPDGEKGTFGETQVYYWARQYLLWQEQALVDLGVLTLGNFNDFTKVLIVVNTCDGAFAGRYKNPDPISTMDDLGENLPVIRYAEQCRQGNPNCTPAQYQAKGSDKITFEGNGGYPAPGVIQHELNHFVMQDYFGIKNGLDCSIRNERKYFQEGGLGRTLPQMFWHHHYGVGYLPLDTLTLSKKDPNRLYRSATIGGRQHEATDATTLDELAGYACGADAGNPYDWGGVVSQPMWEIYHGVKFTGATEGTMGRPATDLGMIKTMYYAADMASASSFPDRQELANRFMEFWELFGIATPTTKANWCDAWAHHGMNTYINIAYCD